MAEEAGSDRCEQPKCASESLDRISQLPDTILFHILSFLNLKESARCDVLSRRWRGLWKWITCLDFDASEALSKCHNAPDKEYLDLLKLSRSKYVAWVNQVLAVHESPILDEFRAVFDLSARCRKHISQWIKFAISKRVKKLEIDLTTFYSKEKYEISPKFSDYLKRAATLSNLQHLTSLSLSHVQIKGEVVEYFLSNCRHLERLDVCFSNQLHSLQVVGESLPLKHLGICNCDSLELIEISAPNLASFSYFGKPPILIKLGDNPLLRELSVGCFRYQTVACALDAFSKLFRQLETLKLSVSAMQVKKGMVSPGVKFTKLRQLILEVMFASSSMVDLAEYIVAAPSLEKCKFELVGVNPKMEEKKRMAPFRPDIEPHQSLKCIEVCGFRESAEVMQLLDFMFEKTAKLEEVIIDPYGERWSAMRPSLGKEERHEEEIMRCRKVATSADFEKSLPLGAKLTVK